MNYYILYLSGIFMYIENSYFGWNFEPQSDAELICNGITCLILAMAFLKK